MIAPVEAYGGQRDAIRLTSIADAVAFIEAHGGDVPFGLVTRDVRKN